jgi:hypothetical protein
MSSPPETTATSTNGGSDTGAGSKRKRSEEDTDVEFKTPKKAKFGMLLYHTLTRQHPQALNLTLNLTRIVLVL